MLAPESTLHLLPWNELLKDIQYLMNKEEERINANKVYYKSIFYKENQDKEKLTRFYVKLFNEQQRYDFFNELLTRLQKFNSILLINALDTCEAKEIAINGKLPENWQIIIRKEKENYSVYYSPIK